MPILVLQGEDDQVLPIADSAREAIELLRDLTLKTDPGFLQGMQTVNAEVLNVDLLEFLTG